jgi:hypothetical protein
MPKTWLIVLDRALGKITWAVNHARHSIELHKVHDAELQRRLQAVDSAVESVQKYLRSREAE